MDEVRERRVSPRFAFFGLLPDWHCAALPAREMDLSRFVHGRAGNLGLANFALAGGGRIEPAPLFCPAAESQDVYAFDFVDPEERATETEPSERGEGHETPDRRLAWLISAILQPPLNELLADGPIVWPHPLFEHQRIGITALLHNRELLLADDMGLGKTIQVLGALRVLAYKGLLERSLVVCPASLMRQWQAESAEWAPELTVVRVVGAAERRAALWRVPAHIHLVAYETLREDVRSRWVTTRSWSVVVLDEASKIKNPESQVAGAVKRLNGDRRWALTGTPIENGPEDLHSILEFLVRNRSRRAGLSDRLGEIQLRRRKVDVLPDLPPKTVVTMPLELGEEQKTAYERAVRDGVYRLRALGSDLKITHVLELLVRLKQLCNTDPSSGRSAKMEDIERRMDSLVSQGHRALVFSQFTDGLFGVEMVSRRLERFRPLSFTGGMSERRRDEVVDDFRRRPEHKVLILSLKAGGVGLNLQSASYVFHLDRWWNPAIEDQAEARAHRMGQIEPVTVYRYICAQTIEERIDQLLADKRELFAQIVDGASLDLPQVLTQDEIFGLLDLGPPSPPADDSPGD